MVNDIIKFYKTFQTGKPDPKISIRQYLENHQYSKEFIDYHFIPLISSIWSTPDQNSLDQPLSSIVSFFKIINFLIFLIDLNGKRFSGSRNYIDCLVNASHFEIELSSHITSIYRSPQIQIHTRNDKKNFYYLFFAFSPNKFLPILMDKNADEIKLFSSFRFQSNLTQLHQNSDLMPPHHAAWSSWNFHTNENQLCTLSYWMNKLQPLQTKDQFFVSLNQNQKKPLYQTVYDHPIFSMSTLQAQKDIGRLQGSQQTFYAGVIWAMVSMKMVFSLLKNMQQLQIQPEGFLTRTLSNIMELIPHHSIGQDI